MNAPLTRRNFVEHSGRLLAGAGLASLLCEKGAASQQKPPLCVGCRDTHLKETGRTDCWSAIKAIGAECVEAAIGEDLSFPGLFHPERKYTAATDAGVEQLTADMRAAGCRISALCTYNRFAERPEVEVELGAKVARAAKALGVPAIRIDVVPQRMTAAEFLKLATATLKRVMDATESTGVAFGIENHGGTTNNPEFLRPLFAGVGSKRLGLTLDTGNFYWFGHPLAKLYDLYAEFAPRVFHTHCKSIKYPESEREKQRPLGWQYGKYNCPIYEGDIDFRRVVAILRKAGYANDLCIEDESLGKFPAAERGDVLAREVRFLRKLAS